MTKEQAEAMRKKLMVATLARKRLVEVAAWLSGCPEIKGNDPYLTTENLSLYISWSVAKLDFALDQFESFMKEGK